VLACFSIAVPLRETKVDSKNIVLTFATPDEKVVGLDVSMQVEPAMNVFNPLDHLIG